MRAIRQARVRGPWRTFLLCVAFCFPGAGAAIAISVYQHNQDVKDRRVAAIVLERQRQLSRDNGCKLLDNFDKSYGAGLRQIISETIQTQEVTLHAPLSTPEQRATARKAIKSRTELLDRLFPLAEISGCPPYKP